MNYPVESETPELQTNLGVLLQDYTLRKELNVQITLQPIDCYMRMSDWQWNNGIKHFGTKGGTSCSRQTYIGSIQNSCHVFLRCKMLVGSWGLFSWIGFPIKPLLYPPKFSQTLISLKGNFPFIIYLAGWCPWNVSIILSSYITRHVYIKISTDTAKDTYVYRYAFYR